MASEASAIPYNECNNRDRAFVRDAIKQSQGGDPNNVDPVIHGFDLSFAQAVRTDPAIFAIVHESLLAYSDVSPAHMRRRFSSSIRAIDMNDNVVRMLSRTNKESWDLKLLEIASHHELQAELMDLVQYNVMSNVSERGKLLNAVIQLHELGTQPLKILDIGCSLNNNLKRLTMQHIEAQHYKNTYVVEPQLVKNKSAIEYKRNQLHTAHLGKIMLHNSPLIVDGIGVDIGDFNNINVRCLAMTQRYPKEIADPVASKQFEQVTAAEPRNIRMLQADARTMDPDVIGRPADIAYMCTMLYQLSAEDIKAVIKTAFDATTDNALIVLQDFVKSYDRKTDSFTFYEDKWPKYSYEVWVYNKARISSGWQKYFVVDSGRVGNITLEKPVFDTPLASNQRVELSRKDRLTSSL